MNRISSRVLESRKEESSKNRTNSGGGSEAERRIRSKSNLHQNKTTPPVNARPTHLLAQLVKNTLDND